MTPAEALSILETKPYSHCAKYTHKNGTCFCAAGVLLLHAGFTPVPEENNLWVLPEGWDRNKVPFILKNRRDPTDRHCQFVAYLGVAKVLDLDENFVNRLIDYSDFGFIGKELTDAMRSLGWGK